MAREGGREEVPIIVKSVNVIQTVLRTKYSQVRPAPSLISVRVWLLYFIRGMPLQLSGLPLHSKTSDISLSERCRKLVPYPFWRGVVSDMGLAEGVLLLERSLRLRRVSSRAVMARRWGSLPRFSRFSRYLKMCTRPRTHTWERRREGGREGGREGRRKRGRREEERSP